MRVSVALPPSRLAKYRPTHTVERNAGTGAIVEWNGKHVVLTAAHVTAGASPARITFSNGRVFSAPVTGRDTTWDLAVIPIPLTTFEPLQLAEADPAIGDCIRFVGYSSGTAKSRASTVRQYVARSKGGVAGWLEGTASAQPGDSGGPMLNAAGELVAVVCTGHDPRRPPESAGPMVSQIRTFLGSACDPPGPDPPSTDPPPVVPPVVIPDAPDCDEVAGEVAELREQLAATRRALDLLTTRLDAMEDIPPCEPPEIDIDAIVAAVIAQLPEPPEPVEPPTVDVDELTDQVIERLPGLTFQAIRSDGSPFGDPVTRQLGETLKMRSFLVEKP